MSKKTQSGNFLYVFMGGSVKFNVIDADVTAKKEQRIFNTFRRSNLVRSES